MVGGRREFNEIEECNHRGTKFSEEPPFGFGFTIFPAMNGACREIVTIPERCPVCNKSLGSMLKRKGW